MYLFRCVLVFVVACQANATSLFQADKFNSLVADQKASSLGDSITVLVYENAKAGSNAGEGSEGNFSVSGNAFVDQRNWSSGLALGNGNNTDASTNRSGYIRAQLTAVVTRVEPGGNLYVEGKQQIRINEELQTITLAGTVRPQDVSGNNTVPSFRIQNAQIGIDGQGSVSDGRNGNVFTRLFRWLGL